MRPDYEGTRPGPYLAGHCSLHWIGRVYSRLVRFFGRDKVIVIAQLQETLQWLREASKDEESAQRLAGRSALLPMLQQQLSEVLESCADLIADGGAHYDGPEVWEWLIWLSDDVRCPIRAYGFHDFDRRYCLKFEAMGAPAKRNS